MRKFITLMSMCSVVACNSLSNNRSYSVQLQKWIGRSEYQLYNAWGMPENEFFVTPDKKVVVYIHSSTLGSPDYYENEIYYRGIDNDGGILSDLFGLPAEKQIDDYYCKTSFVIEDSMIVDYNFNGDYCGG